MGDLGVASPLPPGEDLEMGELASVVHAGSKAQNGLPQSGEGESSSNGKL